MEATDPASGQVFLEHVTTGESKWKALDNQSAAGNEAAAGAAGSGGQGSQAGANEKGGAATSDQKVGAWNEE